MKQRALWSAVLLAGRVALAGCGSALAPDSKSGRCWGGFVARCHPITMAVRVSCFARRDKEGSTIQLFLSGLDSGIRSPGDHENRIAGRRGWNWSTVRRIFSLWKEVNDKCLNNAGANSTVLLAAPASDYVNGIVPAVDGGWLGRR